LRALQDALKNVDKAADGSVLAVIILQIKCEVSQIETELNKEAENTLAVLKYMEEELRSKLPKPTGRLRVTYAYEGSEKTFALMVGRNQTVCEVKVALLKHAVIDKPVEINPNDPINVELVIKLVDSDGHSNGTSEPIDDNATFDDYWESDPEAIFILKFDSDLA